VILKKYSRCFGIIVLLTVVISSCSGCKKRATIEIPKAILQAKSATLDELLQIVNRMDEIQSLKAGSLKAVYTSEKKEGSLIELEKYPKAPGYVLLKRPDSTRLVIQNPVVKKKEISLLSVGDEFRVWIHGRGEFYIGKNSSRELISDDLEKSPQIAIRASHIFEAILPRTIAVDDPALPYVKTEEDTADAKYYILRVYYNDLSSRLRLLREFTIERSGLTISRQRIFDDEGRVVSDIAYAQAVQIDKYTLPLKISIERPMDGYTLELEFKDWVVNPDLKDTTFTLEPVKGVKVIHFK